MNILITGGASGLGASIVKILAKNGENTIYFTYAKSGQSAKEIEAAYPNTKAIFCDFSNEPSLDGLINEMKILDIDVLINNACGYIHIEHFHKVDPAVFLRSFMNNVIPVLKITQQAIKVFRKKKFGKIINIISSAVINTPPIGLSEYVANKSYLLSMSTAWANEGIKFNITSNSISPSFMETNLTSDTDERVVEQIKNDHPLKKLLTTNEVADAVLFFVNASQQINGTNLVINAGTDIA